MAVPCAGNVAVDFYHDYKQILLLAKQLSAKQWRVSVSWARIYPQGDGVVNQKGLDYYKEMVDFMVAIGIEPVLTCYHWDLPQVRTPDYFS